eukprot:UN05601
MKLCCVVFIIYFFLPGSGPEPIEDIELIEDIEDIC